MRRQKQSQYPKTAQSYRNFLPWLTIVIIITITAGLRFRLLDVPLERDEGGYAYTAQLLLQGVPPFESAYDMKMPGLYGVYAVILAIFGQTTAGIHLGLLVINAGTIVLLFFLARRLSDSIAGLMAAASYAAMSLSQNVQGFSANAEQLLLLPAVAGILIMLRAMSLNRLKLYFLSGILLGTAFIIKHQGIFFIAFAGLYLLVNCIKEKQKERSRNIYAIIAFGAGAAIPFCALCVAFLWLGLFEELWFWLFVYTAEYVAKGSFATAFYLFKGRAMAVAAPALLLLILAAIGLPVLIWDKKTAGRRIFVALFCVFSFLSICTGARFAPHYFVLVLPAVSLLAGIAVSSIAKFFSTLKPEAFGKIIPASIGIIALLFWGLAEKEYLFELSPEKISRQSYVANPFPESVKIAEYIKKHSTGDDSIAILGSEPQIYFYAGRRSASRYIYVYPLMSQHEKAVEMQHEMINEIESAEPKFLVFVNIQYSWLASQTSEKLIFEWSKQYQREHYTTVGVIDIISNDQTIYRWDRAAANYRPQSHFWVAIFERIE